MCTGHTYQQSSLSFDLLAGPDRRAAPARSGRPCRPARRRRRTASSLEALLAVAPFARSLAYKSQITPQIKFTGGFPYIQSCCSGATLHTHCMGPARVSRHRGGLNFGGPLANSSRTASFQPPMIGTKCSIGIKKVLLEQKLKFVQLDPILPLERKNVPWEQIIPLEQMDKKYSIATSRGKKKKKEEKN